MHEANYEKIRRRKFFSGEKRDPDFEKMSPRERFRAGVLLAIHHNLVAHLNKRSYEVLSTRFEIFRNLHEKEQEVRRNIPKKPRKSARVSAFQNVHEHGRWKK
ncbi:hypothetical protein TNCV_812131 [Trichonephila clavipes]|nr:hypothetical protein TNCV_812131 [Trichonephila clavipes]